MSPELLLAGGDRRRPLPLFPVRRRRLRRRRVGSARERPARGGAAPGDRGGDRPGLGGEPRLVDPGGRHPVHRLPAGVRRDLGRAARPADAVPDRRRAARLGVRVPFARHVGRPRTAALRPGVLDGEHHRARAAGDDRRRAGVRQHPRAGRHRDERVLRALAGALPARGRRVRAGAVRAARGDLPHRRDVATRRCARTFAGARWPRPSPSAWPRWSRSCSPATARRASAPRWPRAAGAGRSTR